MSEKDTFLRKKKIDFPLVPKAIRTYIHVSFLLIIIIIITLESYSS